MSMVIDNKFEIGDTVYLVTDTEQHPGLIISIKIFKGGEYLYEVIRGTVSSMHYDFELSTQKNVLSVV